MSLAVRPARPDDAPLVHGLIHELADYERLAHECRASEEDVRGILFGPSPRAFCDMAELDGAAVGFALWFYNVSTFEGRHGIYLEDLFVRPHARGRGAGLALLVRLARRCRDEGLARLEWSVLDWNTPSIAFYDRLGATTQSEWLRRRLTGEALAKLAEL
ncbi:MAG TPA: GNAT family N-acetyltransferase [Caulobacteraceae bacterium]|nr:GNAT family N-acetyltransferase [Caulobacteraceae bacterium]